VADRDATSPISASRRAAHRSSTRRHRIRVGEQQRNLLQHAPSDYDLLSLQTGDDGRDAARLADVLTCSARTSATRANVRPRSCSSGRADEGERLLGSFNEIVDNWLDFFTYTQFIDRDGKFS